MATNNYINCPGTVTGSQLISSTTSSPPLQITNSSLVSNLNAQYFNNQLSSYYTNASNISSGVLNPTYGGTGITIISNGFLFIGSNNSFAQSSNLYYNYSSNFFGINTSNPTYPLDINGNTNIQGNLTITGSIVVSNSSNTSSGSNSGTTGLTTSNNILQVTSGGTGLSNVSQGYLLFGTGSTTLGSTSNLFWNGTSNYLGIGTTNPLYPLDISGNIRVSSNLISSNQFVSTIGTGIAPFNITSTTLVSNLNVQYLNGQSGTYYTNASNISYGILSTSYGGTGLSSFQSGLILYASSSNTLSQTSNLTYNSSNSNVQISQLNVTLSSSNTSQAPFIISNSNLVSNLNVQFLNGQLSYYYTNASNISSGLLSVLYGGTGVTTMTTGYVHFGSNGILGQSSNLFWNSTSNYLGIGTSNPQYNVDVSGTLNCTTITQNSPLSLYWIITSNFTVPTNSNVAVSYSNWGFQSNLSKISTTLSQTNIFQSNGNLVIPVNGIYTLTYAARFYSSASGSENATWLQIISGSYSTTGNYNNNRCLYSGTSAGNTYASFTGYFQSNDTFSPYTFSGISNSLLAQYGGGVLQMTLQYRC